MNIKPMLDEAEATNYYNQLAADEAEFSIDDKGETQLSYVNDTMYFGYYEEGVLKGQVGQIGDKFSRKIYIHILYVGKDHRNQGIGHKLLEYALEKIESINGIATLSVMALNTEAIKLYKKFGFKFECIEMVRS